MDQLLKPNKEYLKRLLINTALKFNTGVRANMKPCHWIIDCRELCLSPSGAYLVAALLFEKIKQYDCVQIGGVTLGADPIVGAMVLYGFLNKKPMSGFIIRKKAKAHGLQKIIEGNFKPGQPVIVVDDIVNSGNSLFYALDLLKSFGCNICAVVSIVNFKRKGFEKLKQDKVDVKYLFDLNDLYVENRSTDAIKNTTQTRWQLSATNQWSVTIPRSTPASVRGHLSFGTNEGAFLNVDNATGDIRWRKDLEINNHKGILSSPCCDNERLFFGAYNGYFYCLNANDGSEIWRSKDGHWIGSSPCMDQEKIYVGIEYNDNSPQAFPRLKGNKVCIGIGQKRERGALCAYLKNDGQLIWRLNTGNYIHSSPCVDTKRNRVIVGCNDGYIYAADSQSGELSWRYPSGHRTRAGLAVDEDTGYVYFGSENGFMYCLEALSGRLIWSKKIGLSIYNTPEIIQNVVVISTVSKRIFALDKISGHVQWFYNTAHLIYGSTKTTDNIVYCGDNGGILHEIDFESGRLINQYEVGSEILTRPVIENGAAYLGCKGIFVCIELKGPQGTVQKTP